MTTTLSKRTKNRQQWQDRVDAWRQSGLTQSALCRQQNIKLNSFHRWLSILRTESEAKLFLVSLR